VLTVVTLLLIWAEEFEPNLCANHDEWCVMETLPAKHYDPVRNMVRQRERQRQRQKQRQRETEREAVFEPNLCANLDEWCVMETLPAKQGSIREHGEKEKERVCMCVLSCVHYPQQTPQHRESRQRSRERADRDLEREKERGREAERGKDRHREMTQRARETDNGSL
jgi:hypothetical protein